MPGIFPGPVELSQLNETLKYFGSGYVYCLNSQGQPVRAKLLSWHLQEMNLTFHLLGQEIQSVSGWVTFNSLSWFHDAKLMISGPSSFIGLIAASVSQGKGPLSNFRLYLTTGEPALFIDAPIE